MLAKTSISHSNNKENNKPESKAKPEGRQNPNPIPVNISSQL
jgi:hypothetical protein